MPSITLSVDADVATWASGIAAGAGDHLPIGAWGGADYRSAIRFNRPAWGTWTAITKATLSFYISDHNHVGVRNSSIYVRRQYDTYLWTKAEGTQDCEAGFSAGNNTQYDDIAPTSTDQVSFSSGTTANAKKSVVVTELVRYYFDNDTTKLVFVFDNVGSSDYAELWSEGKSGYDATLVIEYEVQSPPDAPTLTAPAAGAVSVTQTPTFDWNHSDPQGDPQVSAEVRLWNSTGGTLIDTFPVGTTTSLVCPIPLSRGFTYQFDVRTADATGYGPYSAKRAFSIKAAPVTTIDATRYMEFASGAPRLRVKWTCTQTQSKFRVQAGGYDSGWVTSGSQSALLSALALTNGTPVSVTVTVETTDGLQDADTRSFTPRWGLTTHRRDLTTAPVNWGTPVITPGTQPTGASLVVEYGAADTAVAAPPTWYSALSAVPKRRYVFWRAWFIPGNAAGPTLDSIVIPVDAAVTLVDKWGTVRDTPGLAAPWGIDPGEAVYGTRSMTIDCDGAAQKAYSYGIKVRAGRSYILTGLMKSEGNSGAYFQLEDEAGTVLTGGGFSLPTGPVKSDVLAITQEWFSTDSRDVNRFRTPVFEAVADTTVYVVLGAQGVAGAKAWWDALKLEESTVATPWSPGAIGAVVVDAGGVQVDGSRGGVFRYKGSAGATRDKVEGSAKGLLFGGDTELASPSAGQLAANGTLLSLAGHAHSDLVAIPYVFSGTLPATGETYMGHVVAGGPTNMRAPYNGQVMGIAMTANLARTAGTLTARVDNGSAGPLTYPEPAAIFDATTTNTDVTTVPRGTSLFSGSALMRCKLITAGFGPVAITVVVIVWVAYDW